ncbi:hypothetical protein SAMN05216551_101365 [Chitinasiproducens palmae]|uniref:Uncharacterized protein n=1 Tax=Chitinasiproducens palmae TaxID=1770053 RepID=A0A1H2PJE2_9BURK|nr:hypothetical protein SAMN05216551_101365 [Chitinasiproducens palmae]
MPAGASVPRGRASSVGRLYHVLDYALDHGLDHALDHGLDHAFVAPLLRPYCGKSHARIAPVLCPQRALGLRAPITFPLKLSGSLRARLGQLRRTTLVCAAWGRLYMAGAVLRVAADVAGPATPRSYAHRRSGLAADWQAGFAVNRPATGRHGCRCLERSPTSGFENTVAKRRLVPCNARARSVRRQCFGSGNAAAVGTRQSCSGDAARHTCRHRRDAHSGGVAETMACLRGSAGHVDATWR